MSLRSERGEIALTQLLVAMIIATSMLGATLFVFEGSIRVNAENETRNDIQDRARTTLEAMARELRNLASPTQEQPQAVDRATPYDMIFQTVDAEGPNEGLNASNVKRVRYCLDATDRENGKLHYQEQRWTSAVPPAAPTTAACPGPGWDTQRLVADSVVNRRGVEERPIFAYNAAVATDISALHVDLVIDDDTTRTPAETRLSTGVFLRNQNRRPVAVFTATRTSAGVITLNGSSSLDPEGEQLSYVWFDGATKIGTGVTFTYTVTPGTTHSISLRVYDPATLEGIGTAQVVQA